MTVLLAYNTLRRIKEELEKDQGNRFRGLLRDLMPLADDAYQTDAKAFRKHLGASLIGRECERAIWYGFHWAQEPRFEGRILRLFNRGHLEEPRFLALLKLIGCNVWHRTEDGKQFRVGSGGHFGGSIDCVLSGLDEPSLAEFIPTDKALLGEFKTHSEKSFEKLAGDLKSYRKHLSDPSKHPFTGEGVRAAKFEHYVQMQIYMAGYNLPAALYLAVNKNDDEIYAEIVPFDPTAAQVFSERAQKIIATPVAPARLSKDPSWYKCKFCDLHGVCHKGAPVARNCRTCEYSSPMQDGRWVCRYNEHHATEANSAGEPALPFQLDEEKQLAGCEHYSLATALK